jgi:hypothetical protein
MSESLPKDEIDWGPEFAEIQREEPFRQKRLSRWTKLQVNGIYTVATGLATIGLVWSFQSQFSKTSGVSDSFWQMPIFLIVAVAIGSVFALAGGLTFAIGYTAQQKSNRDFDKTMAIILANGPPNSSPANPPHSEGF